MTLKGTAKDIRTIGGELGVQYVLEGSVRKAGDALRVTAQLIDATTDAHLWAEKYAGTLEDIFGMQEEISHKIVDALKVTLSPDEEQRIGERPIDDIHAYECYQKARHENWRMTEASLDRALQLIESALEIVGDNALLYAAMGSVYVQFIHAGIRIDATYMEKAEECAARALALNPDLAEAHSLRAFINYKNGHLRQAGLAARQALTIDPNNRDALFWTGVYVHLGKESFARPFLEKLIEVDPLHYINYFSAGFIELIEGRFGNAAEEMAKMLRLAPDNIVSLWANATALAYDGRRDEACALLDKLDEVAPESPFAPAGRFVRHALRGEKDDALQAVSSEWTDFMRDDEFFAWNMATSYALIDEKAAALDWLEHTTLGRE